uniref:leucine-rich repeat transmembrane neuronal protein 2-like isoform X2 n=1 Tax=Ciona intestinalis TaxID=7719 RepID=UPI000521A257|nr:leucine-rich repeat transmembrane neuronal protein 2-like isoform X2 [Ciona intestinalis]|eukprot:XP_026691702.1 leucine-rich repeat transmembrane neuronal protein 2-like isoform X2 [Ciona intestinalis]
MLVVALLCQLQSRMFCNRFRFIVIISFVHWSADTFKVGDAERTCQKLSVSEANDRIEETVDHCNKFFKSYITSIPYVGCPRSSNTLGAFDCCVKRINAELKEYTEIERFNVEYNYITRIESRIFYFNTKLRTILLNHNNIHTVDDGAFEGLSNLTLLDLAGNNITWLPDGIFKPTVNLDTLNLSDNQLVRIDVTYMTTLSVLNLAGNNLAEWTADHENMLSLRLRGNKLTRWKRLNMPNIQKLDLSNNEITTVDYDAFIQCRQLMDLNLSRNYLTTMDKNIVFELCQLVSFDIRMNKLTKPHPEWFENVVNNGELAGSVTSLALTTGNDWQCNQELKHFQSFLEYLQTEPLIKIQRWHTKFRIDCNSQHEGKSLMEVDLHCQYTLQTACSKNYSHHFCGGSPIPLTAPSINRSLPHPYIAGGSTVLLFFAAAVIFVLYHIKRSKIPKHNGELEDYVPTYEEIQPPNNGRADLVIRTEGYCTKTW